MVHESMGSCCALPNQIEGVSMRGAGELEVAVSISIDVWKVTVVLFILPEPSIYYIQILLASILRQLSQS